LTALRLRTAKRYIECMLKKADELGYVCEKPGCSIMCNLGSRAWVKWIFAGRVHLCPDFFKEHEGMQVCDLIHE